MNPFIDRSQKIKDLCSSLGISSLYIHDHQARNQLTLQQKLTYHNYAHMHAVTIQAFELAKNQNLALFEQHVMFWAGELHDDRHCQRKGIDRKNIEKAVEHCEQIIRWSMPYNRSSYIDIVIHETMKTIECTEFPFIYVPDTRVKRIIRDADLTMMMQSDGGYFLKGLCNELELKPENGKQAVEEHKKFLASCEFYTPAGKKLYKKWYEGGSPVHNEHWESIEQQFDEASK
jgi:hypothetical protein